MNVRMSKEKFASNKVRTKQCKGCSGTIPLNGSTYCRACKAESREYVTTRKEIEECAEQIHNENAKKERIICKMKLSSYRQPRIYHVVYR